MAFIGALLIGAGRCFGVEVVKALGCAVGSVIAPMVVSKTASLINDFRKKDVPDSDPDLC